MFTPTSPACAGVATLAEIEIQGWSMNPGRYVGLAVIGPSARMEQGTRGKSSYVITNVLVKCLVAPPAVTVSLTAAVPALGALTVHEYCQDP